MKICSQCGKQAMYEVEGGHLLCLDCFYKFQSIKQQELASIIAHKNFLIEQMEATVGLPGMFPKQQIPQPSPVINRNVNISNSTVGGVNTGYIENMNVNFKYIEENGNEDLAKQLKVFTGELVKENMNYELKNEVLEHIEFLSNQLAGKEHPRKGMIKTVLRSISSLISDSESLVNIWNAISEKIVAFVQ